MITLTCCFLSGLLQAAQEPNRLPVPEAGAPSALLAMGLQAPDDSARIAVPEAAAQKEQEVLIRSLFKAEYAKTAIADRRALAAKLFQQAGQGQDNAAARFVLYRESRDLAAEGGDIYTSFAAIDAMAASFRIAALPMKVASLATTAKVVHTMEDFQNLALWYLKLADEAVAADDYDTAATASGRAATMGRGAKDPPLTSRAEFKSKEVGELKLKFDAVRKAREILVDNPDDGPANAAVGEYFCLVRGDWSAGLPMLSKGQGRFRDLARMDLSGPTKAEEQMTVGDGWWDASERERGRSQENVRRRAIYWYDLAAPGLTGVLQLKVHQRRNSLLPGWSTTGLFAYWKMDEGDGTVVADSSGNRRNGKVVGATWTKGVSGSALHFDGGSQKVILDAGEVPVPWTAMMWVRREPSPNATARIMDGAGYEKRSSLRLEQSSNTGRVGITKYRVIDYAFPYTAPAETWTHLAWVGTAKSVSLYANGVQVGLTDQVIPLSVDRLGSQDQGSFKGSLDEVRIYSRELNAPEIEMLYQLSRR